MSTAPPIETTETDLVRRAQNGDRAAFQELYKTYLPKIYDFTLGMLRNSSDAEDATSETFLRTVERLASLREPAAFKGWLYTIARNEALRIVDGRKKAVPVAEHLESATTLQDPSIPQPEAHAEQAELRALFDDAASTLSERDRTVFELTLRHGLGSAEIARVLHVRPAYAYILANRLKGSVTEALEAVLLARIGRDDCAGLADVLDRFDGEVSPRMRKAISRHTRACKVCEDTKRRRAAIPVLLEGMAWAEPGSTFAADLAGRLDAHWTEHAPNGPTGPSGGNGFAHLVGAAVGVVVLCCALTTMAAQRTIVPTEEGPTKQVLEVLDAPEPEAEEPEAAPAPRRVSTAQHSEPAGDGSARLGTTRVDVSNGTRNNDAEGGDTDVSSDNQADTGPDAGAQDSAGRPVP